MRADTEGRGRGERVMAVGIVMDFNGATLEQYDR